MLFLTLVLNYWKCNWGYWLHLQTVLLVAVVSFHCWCSVYHRLTEASNCLRNHLFSAFHFPSLATRCAGKNKKTCYPTSCTHRPIEGSFHPSREISSFAVSPSSMSNKHYQTLGSKKLSCRRSKSGRVKTGCRGRTKPFEERFFLRFLVNSLAIKIERTKIERAHSYPFP